MLSIWLAKYILFKMMLTAAEEERKLDVRGLFYGIGHQPNSSIVQGQIELDEKGYVVVSFESQILLPAQHYSFLTQGCWKLTASSLGAKMRQLWPSIWTMLAPGIQNFKTCFSPRKRRVVLCAGAARCADECGGGLCSWRLARRGVAASRHSSRLRLHGCAVGRALPGGQREADRVSPAGGAQASPPVLSPR